MKCLGHSKLFLFPSSNRASDWQGDFDLFGKEIWHLCEAEGLWPHSEGLVFFFVWAQNSQILIHACVYFYFSASHRPKNLRKIVDGYTGIPPSNPKQICLVYIKINLLARFRIGLGKKLLLSDVCWSIPWVWWIAASLPARLTSGPWRKLCICSWPNQVGSGMSIGSNDLIKRNLKCMHDILLLKEHPAQGANRDVM